MKKKISINIKLIGTVSKGEEPPPREGLIKVINDWLLENYDMIETEPSQSPITVIIEDIPEGGDVKVQ